MVKALAHIQPEQLSVCREMAAGCVASLLLPRWKKSGSFGHLTDLYSVPFHAA